MPRKSCLKDKDKENILKLYSEKYSGIKISEKLNLPQGAVYHYINSSGIARSNKENSRKYHIDHSFFKNIDTEEKAYWLGFIYADGYVSYRKNDKQKKIGIALSIKDKEHLELFNQCLKSTYPIKTYQSGGYSSVMYSRINIVSDEMFDDLVSKGVSEHKTLTLTFPNQSIVPDEMIHHFIRGYFDGDGSFSKAAAHFKLGYMIKICGTREFLESIQDIFNLKTKLTKRKKDNKNNWTLEIGAQKDVLNFSNTIYQNATLFLKRKHDRYQEILLQSS